MEPKNDPHQAVLGKILLLYFLPVLALSLFAFFTADRWSFLCLGLFLSALGTFLFGTFLRQWEAELEPLPLPAAPVEETQAPPAPDVTPYLDQIQSLQLEVSALDKSQKEWIQQTDRLTDQLQQITQERDFYKLQSDTILHESNNYKKQAHEEIEELRLRVAEQQRTIVEQRESMDHTQQQIQQFESKVRDLNYEIKTLLKLAERSEALAMQESFSLPLPQKREESESVSNDNDEVEVNTPEEALVELKRCIYGAQKIMGASSLGGDSRFKELSMDNLALDLRRLFDRLRSVHTSTIFVYSTKESKVLFVNDQVEKLLGIAAEKFIQMFNEVVLEGQEEWQKALNQLSYKQEAKIHLPLKTRTGQEIPLQGLVGSIPTGLFRSYVIGVLYPTAENQNLLDEVKGPPIGFSSNSAKNQKKVAYHGL